MKSPAENCGCETTSRCRWNKILTIDGAKVLSNSYHAEAENSPRPPATGLMAYSPVSGGRPPNSASACQARQP